MLLLNLREVPGFLPSIFSDKTEFITETKVLRIRSDLYSLSLQKSIYYTHILYVFLYACVFYMCVFKYNVFKSEAWITLLSALILL